MQGTGNNRFEPNRPLTRAEFCKLAVTAMGIDDASPYASYTIFPDVHASHWAARYVNAALRHPDFKDNYIIRGYADGTFGPDRQLTYGEVCTMLLRMLGYKESDIGPFWPADYIAQANALGLTQGISIKDAKTPVTRADAATMLLNTLGTSTRSDGQEGLGPSSAVFHPRRLKTALSSKPAKPTARLRQMKRFSMKTARSLRARPQANSTAA